MRSCSLLDSLRGKWSRSRGLQRRRGGLRRRPLSIESLETRILPAAVLVVSDAWVVEGNTGVKQAAVTVSLTVPHGNSVTVDYRSMGGTATEGADYTAVSGKLTFTKDQMSKTIFVPVKGDHSAEIDEQFSIVLSNAKGAKIQDGTGLVTIDDDEPLISISDIWAYEGDADTTPFKFTISLSTAWDLPVTVNYATADGSADGSDYATLSGSYTFAPGETSKDIFVDVIGDHEIESNETFLVNLTSSDAQFTNSVGTGTIADDEPQISISDSYYYGYGNTLTFYVYLSAPAEDVVTVDYATRDETAFAGFDYESTTGTLTFEPGQTAQSFDVVVLNPSINGQYFWVDLSNASDNATLSWSSAIGYWYYDYWYYGGYDYGYDYYYYY